MLYSPVNPYEKICLRNVKEENFQLGCDGSGVIIGVGPGVDSAMYLHKKIAIHEGGWQKVCLKNIHKDNVIVMDEEVDPIQAATACVNPLTAIGMVDTALKAGCNSVVQLAASSQLGAMVLKFAHLQGVETLNVVRREEQVAKMQQLIEALPVIGEGQQPRHYVLNSSAPNFYLDAKTLIDQLQPRMLFDVVGGELPARLFECMPEKSVLLVVGNLTHEPIPVRAHDIIGNQKQVRGLMLWSWMDSLQPFEREKWRRFVANDFLKPLEDRLFTSTVVKILPFEEWEQAVELSEVVAS